MSNLNLKETNFFNDLLNHYNNIKFKEDEIALAKIDKNISYYLADDKNQFIIFNNPNIIEVDITSAFPTIVNALFGDCEFTREVFNKKTKKERNIFIAISLKETEYLRRFNNICKMIIYGILSENLKSYVLIELKKDGVLIQCDDENLFSLKQAVDNISYYSNSLTECVMENKFNFHVTKYQHYSRCNKTSFFLKDDILSVKGKYKYIPLKLRKALNDILLYKTIDLFEIKQIYSNVFWEITKTNFLKEYLFDYYICDDTNKIINDENKYVKFNNTVKVNPELYLKNFVYPILASTRLK